MGAPRGLVVLVALLSVLFGCREEAVTEAPPTITLPSIASWPLPTPIAVSAPVPPAKAPSWPSHPLPLVDADSLEDLGALADLVDEAHLQELVTTGTTAIPGVVPGHGDAVAVTKGSGLPFMVTMDAVGSGVSHVVAVARRHVLAGSAGVLLGVLVPAMKASLAQADSLPPSLAPLAIGNAQYLTVAIKLLVPEATPDPRVAEVAVTEAHRLEEGDVEGVAVCPLQGMPLDYGMFHLPAFVAITPEARRVTLALTWLREVPLAPLTADGMVKGILMAQALDVAGVSDELATITGALWSLDGALGGAGWVSLGEVVRAVDLTYDDEGPVPADKLAYNGPLYLETVTQSLTRGWKELFGGSVPAPSTTTVGVHLLPPVGPPVTTIAAALASSVPPTVPSSGIQALLLLLQGDGSLPAPLVPDDGVPPELMGESMTLGRVALQALLGDPLEGGRALAVSRWSALLAEPPGGLPPSFGHHGHVVWEATTAGGAWVRASAPVWSGPGAPLVAPPSEIVLEPRCDVLASYEASVTTTTSALEAIAAGAPLPEELVALQGWLATLRSACAEGWASVSASSLSPSSPAGEAALALLTAAGSAVGVVDMGPTVDKGRRYVLCAGVGSVISLVGTGTGKARPVVGSMCALREVVGPAEPVEAAAWIESLKLGTYPWGAPLDQSSPWAWNR